MAIKTVTVVLCEKCGKMHRLDSEDFVAFHGKVTIGENGGIVGKGDDTEHVSIYCRNQECLNSIFEIMCGSDAAYDPIIDKSKTTPEIDSVIIGKRGHESYDVGMLLVDHSEESKIEIDSGIDKKIKLDIKPEVETIKEESTDLGFEFDPPKEDVKSPDFDEMFNTLGKK